MMHYFKQIHPLPPTISVNEVEGVAFIYFLVMNSAASVWMLQLMGSAFNVKDWIDVSHELAAQASKLHYVEQMI